MKKRGREKRLSTFFYKRACIGKLPVFSRTQVETDLMQLYPGESLDCLRTEYYIEKISLVLKIIAVGALFAVAAGTNQKMNVLLREGGVVERSEPGGEEIKLELEADYEEECYALQFRLAAREPDMLEAREWIAELSDSLPDLIVGENLSLTMVTTNLALWEQYEGFPIKVAWESSKPEVIDELGTIQPGEQSEQVSLKAEMSCGEYSEEISIIVTILPEYLSEKEQIYRELENYLAEVEKAGREEKEFVFPEDWKGKHIVWREKQGRTAMLVLAGTIAVAVAVYFLSDRDLHEKLKKRKKQLQEEYPDFVHELVLFVGAGMTTRGALQKIAGDYERKKRSKGEVRLACEEALRVCREMQSGVSEGAAYERFGRRIGLQQYIRLSGLLMQNLKRGNSTLIERLHEEAYRAGEEKLQLGKRLGEEAATKLLIPMVMMLAVVMLLIMIPAFSSL